MFGRQTVIAVLTLGSILSLSPSFAAETATAAISKSNDVKLSVAHGSSFDTTLVINGIRYPVNIYLNWTYKTDTSINNYLDSNKIIQNVKDYLSAHNKNGSNLEALTNDLAYNMLDQYTQLQAFTVTFNVLATSDRIVSDYSSVTASYHNNQ